MFKFSNIYLERAIFSLGILIAVYILTFISRKIIDIFFTQIKARIRTEVTLAKTRTVRNLLKNILGGVLYFIAILVILDHWGLNIFPILTGAGILGLAFSFGSQTLVKDVLAGFFIIFEDQFSLGDKVKILTHEGVVHNVTLRLTVLKDKNGNLIYIPNSQITAVIRYNSKPKISSIH
jgi:moderate conductance mechanosensitive channel